MFVLKYPHDEKYLGGELAMWTDQYCENYQCWNDKSPKWTPRADWMFQQEYDKEYVRSILGMVCCVICDVNCQ